MFVEKEKGNREDCKEEEPHSKSQRIKMHSILMLHDNTRTNKRP
jgi:hypothetical protein